AVPVPDAGGGGRRRSADVEDVFDRVRHAVQQAAIVSCREITVGLRGLAPCLVRGDEDERVQLLVPGGDLPETLLEHLDRADLAGAQRSREFLNCGHHDRALPPNPAARSARVACASDSRIALSSGWPRRSASAIAAASHASTDMPFTSSPKSPRRRAAGP